MDLSRWQRATHVFCLFPMCHAADLGELTNYIRILSNYIYSCILVFGNHIFGQLDGYLKKTTHESKSRSVAQLLFHLCSFFFFLAHQTCARQTKQISRLVKPESPRFLCLVCEKILFLLSLLLLTPATSRKTMAIDSSRGMTLLP